MKLVLDHERCTGHGRCYVLAPELFDADDEGYSVLKHADVPPTLEQRARVAELNCPERAIAIAEG
jgi:ferredoxin